MPNGYDKLSSMAKLKVAVTLDSGVLDRVDILVQEHKIPEP